MVRFWIPVESETFDDDFPDNLQLTNTLDLRRHPSHYYIEGEMESPKFWRDFLDPVITIFRLFKPGWFSMKRVHVEGEPDIPGLDYYINWRSSGDEKPMRIGASEAEKLAVHFRSLEGINPALHYPIRAFTNFYFYPRYPDRFIAIAIALDGLLFSPDEDKKSGRYEFSRRLAFFLDPSHEPALHEECLRFYLWRNQVIHGKGAIDQIPFPPIVDPFENHCRMLICKQYREGLIGDTQRLNACIKAIPKQCCTLDRESDRERASDTIMQEIRQKLALPAKRTNN